MKLGTIKQGYTDGGTNDYVMRNGLGARGVDYVAKTQSSTTTVGFPLYDAHGNNVSTLSRNGSGGFNVNDRRAYDAWGIIRQGNTTGDPKGRYCAQLGHVQDDESGLLYMRARYYEPTSARFISEDSAKDGENWFIYANNISTSIVDASGNDVLDDCIFGLMAGFFGAYCYYWWAGGPQPTLRDLIYGGAAGIGFTLGAEYLKTYISKRLGTNKLTRFGARVVGFVGGVAGVAAFVIGLRAGECLFELFLIETDELGGQYL